MATVNQTSGQQSLVFPNTDELKNYSNRTEIGHGTYGTVFKARDINTGTIVALKCISKSDEPEGFPLTALREISILKQFTNENIVQILGICRSPRENSIRYDFYLILEYCDCDLNSIITSQTLRFTQDHIKSIMYQTLVGLAFLHENKVIHRDIKPGNILMKKDGILKLADFGLSKVLKPKGNNRENRDTNRYVSRWYRAPELLLGDQNYDTISDMWSVGCTFAELWTKEAIMRGENENHQLALIQALRGNIKWPGVQNLIHYQSFQSFLTANFPISKFLTDYKNYIRSPFTVDFINRFLTLDPKQRIDANTAINSDFFRSKPSSNVLKSLFVS